MGPRGELTDRGGYLAFPPGLPSGHTSLGYHVKWNKSFKILTWECVRPYISQFKAFLDTTNLPESQAKLILLQNTKGLVLNFVEVIIDEVSVEECLGQLLEWCDPQAPQS